MTVMEKEKYKKTLIQPKVRLLLTIYLEGISGKGNWRKKVSESIEYGKGNVDTQLISLLDDKLIESLNLNKRDPPYRVTKEGKRFLQPILFTSKIGMAVALWVSMWAVIYYFEFQSQIIVMITFWLPLLITSFIILALVLIFYPYILLKAGKIGY